MFFMRALVVTALVCVGGYANGIVLISNYPQTNDTNTSARLTTARQKALGFIMPSTSYFLDTVKVRLQFTSAATTAQIPVVRIHAAGTSTSPGAVLFTLTAPGGYITGAGNYTFTAASSFTL